MKLTGNKKEICGREVGEIKIDTFEKKVVRFGHGAHISVPTRFLGNKVRVDVLGLRPFACKLCLDTFVNEENFSPDEDLCDCCFMINPHIEKSENELREINKKKL